MASRIVGQIGRVVWFVVAGIATLALFNYPRTWVQELVTETSLLWAPLCLVGITAQLRSFKMTSFSPLGAVLFVLQVMCVVRTVHIVAPYLYAAPRTYSDLSYAAPVRFLMVDISDRFWTAPPEALASLIDAEKPSVVVVLRYRTNTALSKLTERYSFTVTSSVQSDRTVEIFSKLPVRLPARTEVGYGALPAILGVVETGDGAHLQLGAVDLLPAYSQDAFVKSRLTSRRLASSLKYSTEPRMVMGAFRASITSQVVDMYVDQLRFRSVFFDSGLAKLRDLVCQSLLFEKNFNVFAARNIEMFHVVEPHGVSDGFSAILFDARIPKAPIQTSLPLQ